MKKNFFDALVQWCFVFSQSLSQLVIEEATVCTLHGAVIRQQLNGLLGEEGCGSFGKKRLLTVFDDDGSMVLEGIPCTLGALQRGQVEARLCLEFAMEKQKKHREKVLRQAAWCDMERTRLIPRLQVLQRDIRRGRCDDGKIIGLADLIKNSGYVGERSLKYKVALAAARGVTLEEIPAPLVRRTLLREVIDKKEYVRHGSTATVALYNGRGGIVGSRALLIDP